MLSKPNVNELLEKVGNRYEIAVAVAKRARDIADKRVKDGSKDITDPVDVAAKEIYDGRVIVVKREINEEVEEDSTEVSNDDDKIEVVKDEIVKDEIVKDEQIGEKAKTRKTKSKNNE